MKAIFLDESILCCIGEATISKSLEGVVIDNGDGDVSGGDAAICEGAVGIAIGDDV